MTSIFVKSLKTSLRLPCNISFRTNFQAELVWMREKKYLLADVLTSQLQDRYVPVFTWCWLIVNCNLSEVATPLNPSYKQSLTMQTNWPPKYSISTIKSTFRSLGPLKLLKFSNQWHQSDFFFHQILTTGYKPSDSKVHDSDK